MKNKCRQIQTAIAISSLALAAWAFMPIHAEGHTITIKNAALGEDDQFIAYKVFDASHSGSAVSYTIEEDSPFYDTVSAYTGITLTKAAGTQNTYIVTKGDQFDAAIFASLLRNDTTKPEPAGSTNQITGTGKDATAVITVPEEGYYYVNTTTGAIASLDSATDNAVVVNKNFDIFTAIDPETSDENFCLEIDDHDAEVGQVINYKVHSIMPSTTGYSTYTYTIEDKLAAGLQLDKSSLKISYNNAEPVASVDGFTIDTSADNAYKVTIDAKALNGQTGQDAVGYKFFISYAAKVLPAAVDSENVNDVVLNHSKLTDNGSITTEQLRKSDYIYSYKIVISKYDASNTDNKLADAQFILGNADGSKFYKLDNNTVSWITAENAEAAAAAGATVLTTDTDGSATFAGLEASSDDTTIDNRSSLDGSGKYKIYEIKAPAGYNLLKDPVEASLTRTGSRSEAAIAEETYEIANSSGLELPETGSKMAMILTIIGSAGIAALIITSSVKKNKESKA